MRKYEHTAFVKWIGLIEVYATFTSTDDLSRHHGHCRTKYHDDEDDTMELVVQDIPSVLQKELDERLIPNSNITSEEYGKIVSEALEAAVRKQISYYKVLSGRIKKHETKQEKKTWKDKLKELVSRKKKD